MKVEMLETTVGRGAPDAPKTTFYKDQSYDVDERVAEAWIAYGSARKVAPAKAPGRHHRQTDADQES